MTKAKQLVNRLRRRRTYQSVFEVLEPGSPGSGPSDWQAGQGGKALTEADIIDKLRVGVALDAATYTSLHCFLSRAQRS